MSYFKDNFIKGAQPDNFTKYANLFAEQFLPLINNDKNKFESIIGWIELKSWRYFNREMRKACDQYCTDKNIMDHAAFQLKWFYEGTMCGRTTYGAKAPWLDGKTQIVKISTAATVEQKPTKPSIAEKNKKYGWNTNVDWDRINKPIFERMGVDC